MQSIGKLRGLSASDAFASIEKLLGVFPSKSSLIRISIQTNLSPYSVSGIETEAATAMSNQAIQDLRNLINNEPNLVKINRFTIQTRLNQNQSWQEAFALDNAGAFGEVSINFQHIESFLTKPDYVKFLKSVHEIFNLTSDRVIAKNLLDKSAIEAIEFKERSVSELQVVVEKLGVHLADGVRKQAEELRLANERLREEWEKKSSELDERYNNKVKDLETREAALEGRIQEFDTRQSKYARRGLLEDLKVEIKQLERFKLSDKAQNKRWPIHIGSALSLLIFGTAATIGGILLHQSIANQLPTAWLFVSMTTAGTLGVGSTIVFYLKWANSWFSEHLRQESMVRRMRTDAIRASWLVELLFEWQDQGNNGPIPPEIIDRLSAGLYSSGNSDVATKNDFAAIKKLIQEIRTLSVGTDGVSISRNKN